MSFQTENPFVGLRPFEADESLLFFGRQDQVMELLQRLHLHHFVAVIGSSGSGKSSLIKAGLIPKLKAGYLVNKRDHWLVASMKPGQKPLHNLADTLLKALNNETEHKNTDALLSKIREEGSDAILELFSNFFQEQKSSLFILVDQFEELFRFSSEKQNKNEAIDFVNVLLELAAKTELPLYVVITMRSDFIGDCDQFFGLPEALNRSQYLVPRLNRLQLKAAIESPVKLYGGKINPALTSKLLNAVQSTRDELPLLQHVLMRIWDHEYKTDRNGELDLQDYIAVGGIEKALSQHAEEALQGLSEEDVQASKVIFQALTAVDDNGRKIRRPVKLSELIVIAGTSKTHILELLNRFNDDKRCFIVLNNIHDEDDILVDISHESLIRQWERLSDWVDAETEASKTYLQLAESAELYSLKRKDLLSGSELQIAELWYKNFQPREEWAKRYDATFTENINYLNKSSVEKISKEQALLRQKRRKAVLIVTGIFLILASSSMAIVIKQRSDANTIKDEADKKLAERKVEENRVKDSLSVAFFLAHQKDSVQREGRTRDSIRSLDLKFQEQLKKAVDGSRELLVIREYMEYDPTIAVRLAEVAMNLANDTLVDYFVYEMMSKKPLYKTIIEANNHHAFCDYKGDRFVTSGYDKNLIIWSLDKKSLNAVRQHEFEGLGEFIRSAEFSLDGKFLVTGTEKGEVSVWDLENNTKKGFTKFTDEAVTSVGFCPIDPNIIFSRTEDMKLRIFTLNSSNPLEIEEGEIITVAAIPNSHRIITGSKDGNICIWDIISGKKIKEIKQRYGADGSVMSVDYSPKNNLIVAGYRNGIVRVYDSLGTNISTLKANNNATIYKVAFTGKNEPIELNESNEVEITFSTNTGNFVFAGISLNEQDFGSINYQEPFLGSLSNLVSFGFSDDLILSASETGEVKVWKFWQPANSDEAKEILRHNNFDRFGDLKGFIQLRLKELKEIAKLNSKKK